MKRQDITLATYVAGFVLSILLTLIAFHVVSEGTLTGWTLTWILMGFAVVQLMVQLVFFLHLDQEKKPRMNLQVFGFMALTLLIVVLGSLWIMDNLDRYHGPESHEVNDYLLEEEGFNQH